MATQRKKKAAKKQAPAKKPKKATVKATTKAKLAQLSKAVKAVNRMPRNPPPAGIVFWHNPVTPIWFDQPPGLRGFRVYKEPAGTSPGRVLCHCGWAPWIGQHYRTDERRFKNYRVKTSSWRDEA